MCHNPKVWNYRYCNTIPSWQKDTKHFNRRRFGKSRDWREEFRLRRKNNVETMCFLGWGATASWKLRRFDTFLTLVKLRSTYRWNVFANISYHCYSCSKRSDYAQQPRNARESELFSDFPRKAWFKPVYGILCIHVCCLAIPKIIWISSSSRIRRSCAPALWKSVNVMGSQEIISKIMAKLSRAIEISST